MKNQNDNPRIKVLIEAVRTKKTGEKMTGLDLSKALEVKPQMVSKWLNYIASPGGEVTLTMLEWVTGRKTGDTLNNLPPPPEEKPLAPSTKQGERLTKRSLAYAASNKGVKLNLDAPSEMIGSILKEHKCWADRSGFELGDFLLGLRETKGNARFDALMVPYGRARETFRIYEDLAASVPPEHRKPWLSFTAARELARLKDQKMQKQLIREIEEFMLKNDATVPTVRKIHQMSLKLKPARKKGPSKQNRATRK